MANGNPDIAFEILMSGGGLGGGAGAPDDYYGEEDPSDSYGGGGAGGAPGGGAGNPFAALASNPNFAMIRQRILQDPNFYQQFM